MPPDRLTCCVPFCRHTRAKRKARKAGLRWNDACTRLWNRCKRIAIERAGGI